jgi:hypothetical protein
VYAEAVDPLLLNAALLETAVLHITDSRGALNVVSEATLRYWAFREPNLTVPQLPFSCNRSLLAFSRPSTTHYHSYLSQLARSGEHQQTTLWKGPKEVLSDFLQNHLLRH